MTHLKSVKQMLSRTIVIQVKNDPIVEDGRIVGMTLILVFLIFFAIREIILFRKSKRIDKIRKYLGK